MAKLLYIESSPRKKRSSSIEVATFFLEQYQKKHPQHEISMIDLWKKKLPAFDGEVIDAKYAILHGMPHSDAQLKAWKDVEDAIAEFKNADKYVISLPMWNFGIPYKLKHYIDVLVQPGYLFKTAGGGYEGLLKGKNLLLIYSRGGAYGSGTGAEQFDLQRRYMETVMQFIGFHDIRSLFIEPTLAGEGAKEKAIAMAKQQAEKLAAEF